MPFCAANPQKRERGASGGKSVEVAKGLSVPLGWLGALPLPKWLRRQHIFCGTPKVSSPAGNSPAGTNTDLV